MRWRNCTFFHSAILTKRSFPTITTILSVQLAGLAMHTTVKHLFEIKDCIGEEEPIIDGPFREMTI